MATQPTVTAYFPQQDLDFIAARVAELGLGARGRSTYFQMLVDYDRQMRLRKHFHPDDNSVRFYPPAEAYPLAVAEDPAPTAAAAVMETPAAALRRAAQGPTAPTPPARR